MELVLSFIGGIGAVGAPYLCLRALATPGMEKSPRWLLLTYGVIGTISFLASAGLALAGNFWVGVLGGALTAVGLYYNQHRMIANAPEPDFVVETALLEDAVSPERRAELESLIQDTSAQTQKTH